VYGSSPVRKAFRERRGGRMRRKSGDKWNRWGAMAMAVGMTAWFLTGCGEAADTVNDGVDYISGQDESVSGRDSAAENGSGQDNVAEGGSGQDNAVKDGSAQNSTVGNGSGQDNVAGNGSVQDSAAEGGFGQQKKGDVIVVNAPAVNVMSTEDMFTDRDLRGDYTEEESVRITLSGSSAQCPSKSVQVSGSAVTITEEGVYILSGSLQEGMIVIAAEDTAKVQLVLDGVSVSNSSNAAVYVKSADKVFLTLAAGTANILENGGSYTELDDNHIDGAIFSKCDLTINGTGSLEVKAAAGHGIVTKDDLRITGGNLTVTAAEHGLSGKDSVRIAGGTFSIISGKDGIRSNHDTNEEKGYVYIGGGSFTINAEGDGISASKTLQIDGGEFAITTGNGSSNRTLARDEEGNTVSTKGMKASGALVVNDGIFVIDAQDDALHSNDSLTINGGEYQIATGDDGFHADETATIAGGFIDISASYEGVEGNEVIISGGYVKLYASDDGVNAAGGNDQSGFGGFMGRDRFGGSGNSSLLISGGTLYINADGDGLDSNGSLTVTGGEVYVSGPADSGNGALDYEGVGQITGGKVVAVGSAGMAMNFGDTSTQGSILVNTSRQTAGSEIVVTDSEGRELLAYTAESAYQSVVVSCPEMAVGGTYTISAGDSQQSVTLESLIYGNGSGMGGFGGRGDRDDRRGQSQEGQIPERGKVPEGGQMPEEGQLPERGQVPEGGQVPERGQMPEEGQRSGQGRMSDDSQQPRV